MKKLLFLIGILLVNTAVAQTSGLDAIEATIKKSANEGKFEKETADLNNDGENDYLYYFKKGESARVAVFLSSKGLIIKRLDEECQDYKLIDNAGKTKLLLTDLHCCGESPFISNRTYEFTTTAVLKDNYVIINANYVFEAYIQPETLDSKTSKGLVKTDKSDVRYEPANGFLKGKAETNFTYGCEENTNIIARLKVNALITILATEIEPDNTWYFIEIDKNAIYPDCDPVTFDFPNQKLRGWISGNFVKKIDN